MYLDGKKIKRIMRMLGQDHNELATFCNVSSSTIWNIITKEKVNTTSDTALRIYRYLKIIGQVNSPIDILNLELIEKEANNGI